MIFLSLKFSTSDSYYCILQSRIYLGLGRDGLLPAIFAKVHSVRQTPVHSQVWVGFIASILAGFLNVHVLSHVLSVGSLVSSRNLIGI